MTRVPWSQADLARLHIGAGSVGALIAEALARTGIARVTLIDFDGVETLNLDRLVQATEADVGRSKVAVLAAALRRSATAERFTETEIEYSIGEEDGFRAALDCDLLFSCVDRPWARSVMNFIAYAHLIPVVDGGIAVNVTGQERLRRADWRAHVAAPSRRCLACLEQYDSASYRRNARATSMIPSTSKVCRKTTPSAETRTSLPSAWGRRAFKSSRRCP